MSFTCLAHGCQFTGKVAQMDLEARRPNHLLRYARQEHGWSQQRVAEQIGTTEDVISRWERGVRMPGPYYRERLCQLFQKTAHDLGFVQPLPAEIHLSHSVAFANTLQKRNVTTSLEHFAFGELQSTWIVLDGDGIFEYLPQNILAHFEPEQEMLPSDLQERVQQIASRQVKQRDRGLPFHWNGQRYSLSRFVISRTGQEEHPVLDLWFTPSDYYTFLATNMALDDLALRSQYLANADWSQPITFFSHSFGIYLAVLTSDGKVLLTDRSMGVGSRPGEYNVSVCEGLSKIDAHTQTEVPDVYRCAERGLAEELGLRTREDWEAEQMCFLSFGVDSWYAQWGVLGMVKVQRTAQDIENYRKTGVKDRLENAQFYAIEFQIDEILSFMLNHQPWAPGGLACLYHTLIHEFGRSTVDAAIKRWAGDEN